MASYSPEPAIHGKPKDRISIVAKATSVQPGSSPISQIVLTQDTARNARLPSFLVEAVVAGHNEKGFVPDCGESKEGSRPAAGWIGEINTIWAKGASNTLELARLVFRARQSMRYGAWAQMWRSEHLPFGFSKAKMLVRIGEHLGDLDGQTFGRLPRGWSTLYELSKLPRAVFEEFLREKAIRPGLKLREAKALVAQFKGKQTEARVRKANFREWLRRSVEFVRNNKSDLEPDERELVARGLTRLAEEINAVETAIFNPSTFITQLGLLIDQQDNL
jgi:hypothetical protein